jgi:arylsulfatase A-like enzyme
MMLRKPKNVLLLVIDCLRADFVYEAQEAHIPNITQLRNEGYSFLNTIASTTTTTPSFASILTGLYPFEHGVRSLSGYRLKNEIVTFPEILKENGYTTYAEITGPVAEEVGLARGFDEYNHRNKEKTIHSDWGSDLLHRFESHYKAPWFVLLHVFSLHVPRIVISDCDHKDYGRTVYGRALASVDEYLGRLIDNLDDNTLVVLTADHGEQIAYSRFDYLGNMAIAKVVRLLKKRGVPSTALAKGTRGFLAAHGRGMYKRMKGYLVGHGSSIYDVLVRVPLIFCDHDRVPVGESAVQIRQIDTFPTIMDLIGVKHKVRVTGESVMPIITGSSSAHRDAYMEAVGVIIPRKDQWRAGIRIDDKYKYIYSPFSQDPEEELYCLESDPAEKQNVAIGNGDLVRLFKRKIEELGTEQLVGEEMDEEGQDKIRERLRSLGYLD